MFKKAQGLVEYATIVAAVGAAVFAAAGILSGATSTAVSNLDAAI